MANESLIRHGDVPLLRISKEKAECSISEAILEANKHGLDSRFMSGRSLWDNGRVVLAYGEQSGHMHVIEDTEVKAFPTIIGTVIVVPVGGADLKHIDQSGALTGEHATINLEEGYWLRLKQREWTLQGNRDVTD